MRSRELVELGIELSQQPSARQPTVGDRREGLAERERRDGRAEGTVFGPPQDRVSGGLFLAEGDLEDEI